MNALLPREDAITKSDKERNEERMASGHASQDNWHFGPAEKLAKDPERVRRDFWRKIKSVAAKIPFAEDLLAAYYCAFDRQTPHHVRATLE